MRFLKASASNEQKEKACQVLAIIASKRSGSDDQRIAPLRALAIARAVYQYPNESSAELAAYAGRQEDELYKNHSTGKPALLERGVISELCDMLKENMGIACGRISP